LTWEQKGRSRFYVNSEKKIAHVQARRGNPTSHRKRETRKLRFVVVEKQKKRPLPLSAQIKKKKTGKKRKMQMPPSGEKGGKKKEKKRNGGVTGVKKQVFPAERIGGRKTIFARIKKKRGGLKGKRRGGGDSARMGKKKRGFSSAKWKKRGEEQGRKKKGENVHSSAKGKKGRRENPS